MTSSALDERPDEHLQGDQHPRVACVPPAVSSAGQEAVELAATAGLELDPWQALVLDRSLGERADGRWAAFEVGLLVSRQNGKGAVLEARELAGLFLFGEQLILHSAHEFKTGQEGFRRVRWLIDNTDALRRRVARVRTSHGEEGIELIGGQRLRFVARTGGSGRGFTGDCVILDEAFNLPEAMIEALLPTVSARPNPQVWYASTAPNADEVPCEQLARLRRRAQRGGDGSLAWLEWSVNPHDELCRPGCAEHDDPDSVRSWGKANPGLGIRIQVEHVAREYASMSAEGFARERLGVGRWPVLDGEQATWEVIGEDRWVGCAQGDSTPVDPVCFAADMTPDRSYGSVAVAGRRADGRWHVEVVDHRAGSGWMHQRLVELVGKWRPCALVVDASSAAGSLIAGLEADGVAVAKPTSRDVVAACGSFYDAVRDQQLAHLGQAELAAALAGARKRDLGGAWAWARKGLSVDISPLVAVTMAMWGHQAFARAEPAPQEVFSAWR